MRTETPELAYQIIYGMSSNKIDEATEILEDYADSIYFPEIVAVGAWCLENGKDVIETVKERYGNA